MRLYLFLLFTSCYIYCDELFITEYEYGQMLYKNPRGIGCIKCHGAYGEKEFITKYKNKNKKYSIYAPAINSIPLDKFKNKLRNKKLTKDIMPTYYLTAEEIRSIYHYISTKKRKNEK